LIEQTKLRLLVYLVMFR